MGLVPQDWRSGEQASEYISLVTIIVGSSLFLYMGCSRNHNCHMTWFYISLFITQTSGLLETRVFLFLYTLHQSTCPGLLLSTSQNEVDKCSKDINFSSNDKYFSPLICKSIQVCLGVLGSIRLYMDKTSGSPHSFNCQCSSNMHSKLRHNVRSYLMMASQNCLDTNPWAFTSSTYSYSIIHSI